MDYLRRSRHRGLVRGLDVRERSVVQLGRRCKFDEPHARHVRELALALFDSGRQTGLHDLGERERELLGYAALLHDIGTFLSYRDHHLHTAYLVRNADLLGFDEEEIELLAAVTRFHRKALPGSRNPELAGLDAGTGARRARSACCCAWRNVSTAVTAGACAPRASWPWTTTRPRSS